MRQTISVLDAQCPWQDAPTVLIRVTHIRDGQVLEVFETPADAIQFDTQGS